MILFALAAIVADPSLLALQRDDARVATVAWRLQTANVAACRDVRPLPGFTLHALSQYTRDRRAAAVATFALDDRLAVLAVATGSAAARAGLLSNDTLVAIDGARVASSPAVGDYAQVAATEDTIDAALADGRVALDVMRGGVPQSIDLIAELGCASRVQLVPGAGLNAVADGRHVQIGGRMVTLTGSDDRLAVVIAHELAHNILGHRTRLDAAGVARGMFAGLGSNGAALRTTELEADRLSVTLVANAGYDLDTIVPFWLALRRARGGDFLRDGTHPSWPERLRALAAVVAQVRTQQSSSQPQNPR